MKKFIPLVLLLISSIFIFSCKDDNDDIVQVEVDYPTVYDINVNLVQNATNYYGFNQPLNFPLLSQDIVLVYRKNNPGQNAPVWEPLPKTYFFGSDEMDYTFDFTRNDVQLDLNANFDLSTTDAGFKNQYINGQTFRVVLVPAVFGGKSSVDVTKLSYDEVIRLYNIDDSKVGTFK